MDRNELKAVRKLAGWSQHQIGVRLGLAEKSAARTVRGWESGDPKYSLGGPARVAATYLAQGVLNDLMKSVLPEYVLADGLPDPDAHRDLVIRLWYPRFVAVSYPAAGLKDFPEDLQRERVDPLGSEWLVAVLWMDDPIDCDTRDLLRRAVTYLELETLDAIADG